MSLDSVMTAVERGELEAVLGHHFEHPERLERALTHPSHRQNSAGIDNERLEFLGDRILGLVASEQLFESFPHWDAGSLSKGLARLVSASSIHAAAQRLNLGRHLRLGPGEEKQAGEKRRGFLPTRTKRLLALFISTLAWRLRQHSCAQVCSNQPWRAGSKGLNGPTTNPRFRSGFSSRGLPPSRIAS